MIWRRVARSILRHTAALMVVPFTDENEIVVTHGQSGSPEVIVKNLAGVRVLAGLDDSEPGKVKVYVGRVGAIEPRVESGTIEVVAAGSGGGGIAGDITSPAVIGAGGDGGSIGDVETAQVGGRGTMSPAVIGRPSQARVGG